TPWRRRRTGSSPPDGRATPLSRSTSSGRGREGRRSRQPAHSTACRTGTHSSGTLGIACPGDGYAFTMTGLAPPLDSRSETEHERSDRHLVELMQEIRVVQTGVQILFGFLLTV